MIVLGLTGSIGMGKSTVAGMFGDLGVPVHSADEAVHALYAGAAAPLVEAAFPGTVSGGVVDRAALSKAVLNDSAALARLETIVHPLVRAAETRFLDAARASGACLAVLDIPLLYETGGEARCDAVAVVSAPAEIQRARVLARPGMTPDRFSAILAKQVPDEEKRRRADIVIDTGTSLETTRAAVERIVGSFAKDPGRYRRRIAPKA
ncbi:dephospho-CoA kinase [Aurantimonas sp. Leaf443]|uniref:dephospho-CoA kinase n=1 Tax=Aurantimonas sp. Leaf443 TaxID=1736378 RepID=UPI0006FE05D9|nr:dephospho-CoA kinase [Aurantimonas sp. Leaf443]KQT85549.1 dephospho-CoA kinase [Aurantimonas sp. Leaf443]